MFVYAIVSKNTNEAIALEFNREDARSVKRSLEQRDGSKYQIVQYAALKAVR